MGNCLNTNGNITKDDTKNIITVRTIVDKFVIEILSLHNELRKTYNLPELKLNDHLTALAENYAEKLMSTHINNSYEPNIYKGVCVGENVVISNSTDTEEIFKNWSDEGMDYDFGKNKFSKKKGHFTQIIWKETTDIGIGFCYDKMGGKYCTVVLYYPAGNTFGDFPNNVTNK